MPSDNTQNLPTTTPMGTTPIEYCTVKLKDGRFLQIIVNDGEGFFRQEVFKGPEKSFTTQQVFVANGRVKVLPSFK